MANRYWVGGTASWDATAGSKWATTSGGAGGQAVPTAADDVFFSASSTGTCTITVNPACRSLDCTGFTGTLVQNSATTLSIGTSTVPASNVALKFVAGMTYTPNAVTSAISFVGTNATQQTVTTAGKTLGAVTFSGSGGSWQLTGPLTATGAFTHSAGTLNTNSQALALASMSGNTVTGTKVLTLGSSAITMSSHWIWRGTTVTANTATITQTGSGSQFDNSVNGGADYNGLSLVQSGAGIGYVGSISASAGVAITLANYTRTGTAVKTDEMQVGSTTLTITGTFTINGNSVTNRILVRSWLLGTARTVTVNGSVVASNIDVQDITGAGSASWNLASITGGSGDALGNSGITFTTPTTLYKVGAVGNWSTAGWATSSGGSSGARVPLPQDDVVMDGNSGSITVSVDMPRAARNLNTTAFAGTWQMLSASGTFYGDITVGATSTISGGNSMTLAGRGARTLTNNGKTHTHTLTIATPGGTYTLQDTLTISRSAVALNITNGTFDANGQNVNLTGAAGAIAVTSGTGTQGVLDAGSGTWTLSNNTASSTFWTVSGNGVVRAANATIVLAVALSSTRQFQGGGHTYGTITYTVAGSTGVFRFLDGNVIGTINVSDASGAKTLQFLGGSSSTILNSFNVFGGSGRLVTVAATTAALWYLRWGYPDAYGNGWALTGTALAVNSDNIDLPGGLAQNYIYTADTAAISTTGDMDVRMRVSQDDWASSAPYLAGKAKATPVDASWQWFFSGTTKSVSLAGSIDGTTFTTVNSVSAVPFANGSPGWLRVTRRQSDGRVQFFTAADSPTMPSSWTQLGSDKTLHSGVALYDSNHPIVLGGPSFGASSNFLTGNIYRYQLRNNVADDGSGIVADFDASLDGNVVSGVDYVAISHSQAGGNATWYAGANSTNTGNNAGWTFTDAPAGADQGQFFAVL